MKWLRFEHKGAVRYGTLDGDSVVVEAGDPFNGSAPTGERLAVGEIRWLTPTEPRTMVALWNNFHALAAKNGWAIPAEPLYLLKSANSFAAHRDVVHAPRGYDGRVTYEGELAIVIGRTAHAVSVADAPAHILGYTCANDVTALDIIGRDPGFAQWSRAKSFAGFGIFGPVIDTDFEPAGGELVTLLNGRERQRYRLADMIFAPATLVSRLSQDMTLQPGDVILCGTSLGVLPMKPGSRVDVVIEGIGTLTNTYEAAP